MARPKCYETAALKQKAYRARKKLGGGEKSLAESVGIKTLAKSEIESKFESSRPSSIRDAAQLPSVSDLRELMEGAKSAVNDPTLPVLKPKVFLNDYGAVISESTWNQLQERKRVAKEKGFEYDEYSQT